MKAMGSEGLDEDATVSFFTTFIGEPDRTGGRRHRNSGAPTEDSRL
jgi:hypothetical protein